MTDAPSVPPPGSGAQLERRLCAELAAGGPALVAFSGGVDSTYLLDVAHEVLGRDVVAVTADSASLARAELARARAFCRERGIEHRIVATDELSDPAYVRNDGERCYVCKTHLFRAMASLARGAGASRGATPRLLLGAIVDDLDDHRPGMHAARELGAEWPLAELGYTKADVRACSRARGLAGWDRPAQPCLSSRIPYGETVDRGALGQIEAAERLLGRLGFVACRARHHRVGGDRGALCRIEVAAHELERVLVQREELVRELKRLGYRFVALDLEGHTSGGLNVLLREDPSRRA